MITLQHVLDNQPDYFTGVQFTDALLATYEDTETRVNELSNAFITVFNLIKANHGERDEGLEGLRVAIMDTLVIEQHNLITLLKG